MSTPVHLEIARGVASITLDDGKVNALSLERINELNRALDEAESAGAIAVLRGRDGIFSAGFDLATFDRGLAPGLAMVRAGAELILRLLAFPAPVLTVCTGHAYPMGAFLMLAADRRLALTGDWRIGLNEVAIGMTLPGFAVELARHRLSPAAFALTTTGVMFSPADARAHGYVDRLVEAAALETTLEEEVARLAGIDRASHVATKARVHGHAIAAIRAALESEAATFAATSA